MTEEVEAVVVGAGVVGLAVARQLAMANIEVVMLESANAIGTEITSRNSEVIHAGIYYGKDSLKAKLCVEGREKLYRYCTDRGVPYRKCGKLIVAADPSEISTLEDLAARGAANGVHDLDMLEAKAANRLEPQLRCVAALLSPSSGVLNTHAFLLSLLGEAEDRGAMLALNTPVLGGEVTRKGILLACGGSEPMSLRARMVVNTAGLSAPAVARSIAGIPSHSIPTPRFAKGNYFKLRGRAPFSRLVYPVPEPGGLGVHATLDMAGQVRFGPDVEWIERIDYDVSAERSQRFYGQIRRYWPGLPDGALSPDYAGVRPKIVVGDTVQGDFMISGPADHGVAGLVNLYGIESPGLTASLAIAERVRDLIVDRSA